MYVHTYICTYIHTYIHMYVHTYICTYIHTYIHMYVHTYIHANAKMQILLPLGGHAHLAEPGCLCTKQALGACASKLLENGLGTCRRTSYLASFPGLPLPLYYSRSIMEEERKNKREGEEGLGIRCTRPSSPSRLFFLSSSIIDRE